MTCSSSRTSGSTWCRARSPRSSRRAGSRWCSSTPPPGEEATGAAPTDDELAWCARHWPVDGLPVGARVEVGLTRDQAWSGLVARVRDGILLAVDYGHTAGERPAAGTLTATARGRVVPVPDGTCDLTAHVAVDSLEHDELTTQRAALRELGLDARTPAHDLARTDPAGYLAPSRGLGGRRADRPATASAGSPGSCAAYGGCDARRTVRGTVAGCDSG